MVMELSVSEPDPLADVVRRAQAGDAVAFTDIVHRFQDLAVGSAFAWLKNLDDAHDVAQEAFLDAHRLLPQLKEPAAFPGWFRRIVIKHCDRVTRRPAIEQRALAAPADSDDDNPARSWSRDAQARHLRYAIEALPEAERSAIALHYFTDRSGPEIARFLELSVATLKKRLWRARRRLREEGDRLMTDTTNQIRPSRSSAFSDEIAFFIAIRDADYARVSAMLDATPSLTEAQQHWSSTLVHEGVLPFANHATPLITAIERDDPKMARLLLDAGADPDGCCGCVTGEPPLWAATLLDRPQLAEALLQRGANPNRPSASGTFPLHLAAMRGNAALVDLLLEHGADADLRDGGDRTGAPWHPADGAAEAEGRTAAQWAAQNGHAVLAARLGATETEAVMPSIGDAKGGIVETGVKAIDLFVPLERGGLYRFPMMAGVGMIVLLGELCMRHTRSCGQAVWTGFAQPPFDVNDLNADLAEFGLQDIIENRVASFTDSPERQRATFEQSLAAVEGYRAAGRDTLVVLISTQGFEHDVEASFMRLAGAATTIVITPYPGAEGPDHWAALRPPFAGQLSLDRKRATRHFYPALSPTLSLSAAHRDERLDARHTRIARAAASLLADYMKFDPELERHDVDHDDARWQAATHLLRYLAQPFLTTEPFTGRPGEVVSRDTMLDEVEAILNASAG